MFDLSLEWVTQAEGLLQPSDLPASAGLVNSVESEIRLASVLIPVFWHRSEWHLLFIRRVVSERDRHSGQVAFPGGRQDPSDSDAKATALREASEEIGLNPSDVKVLGCQDAYLTSSNYRVTPVVAVVPWPYDYKAQETEVARIFSIPLNWLCDQNHVELRDRAFSLPEARRTVELKVVYFDRFDNELLWGATARMTLSFLKALHDGRIQLDAP